MNKYQRVVLIAVGLLIALIQAGGIAENGLDESRGWAISFLIASALLFFGLGSWEWVEFLSRRSVGHEAVPENKAAPSRDQLRKIFSGIPDLELQMAVQSSEKCAREFRVYAPSNGNGKSSLWNCHLLVYGSMRYAAKVDGLHISEEQWKAITRKIAIRMAGKAALDEGSQVNACYVRRRASVFKSGGYQGRGVHSERANIGPLTEYLGVMFGCDNDPNAMDALVALIGANIQSAIDTTLREALRWTSDANPKTPPPETDQ